jgi:hypothetical protein
LALEGSLEGLRLRAAWLGLTLGEYPSKGFAQRAAATLFLEKHLINLIAAGVAKAFKGKD